ncbi:type II toxin-antitoxin system [compost metagenome]
MADPRFAHWQLQEAKNKLSQVVDQAQTVGPQVITRHGRETAVLLSFEAYQALLRSRESLADFFERSPLFGLELETAREADTGRDIEL